MPSSRRSQKKRRSRPYNPADWTTARAKARFPFSLFRNTKLFFVIGALIMIGSVGTGALVGGRRATTSTQASLTPEATAQATAAATPEGTAAADLTPVGKHYDAPPEMSIDPNKSYVAVIRTEKGDIRVELDPKDAPQLVNNFVFLARDGFYDGLTFYRVVPGFVAQSGDPVGDGTGGPGYFLPPEENGLTHEAGVIAMARDTVDRIHGSQFYITYAPEPHLDRAASTVFGRVVSGMDVLESLTPRDPDAEEEPPPGDRILTIDIEES